MSENRRRRNNGAQNRQVKKARTNNARRILLLVGLMSLVAVISIGGTIAWLTDQTEAVTNTFTTADIDIELTETWNADDPKDSDTQFDHWEAKLVPGTTYAKDPKVTVNAVSEPCWLFIKVTDTNNKINGLEGNVLSYSVNETNWTAVDGHTGFYYKEITTETTAATSYNVLTGTTGYPDGFVTVNSGLTKAMEESMKTNGTTPTITVMAAAVQHDNVSTVSDAWGKLPPEFTGVTTTP